MIFLLKNDRASGFIQKINESNYQFNTYGLFFGAAVYNLYLLVDTNWVPEIIWLDVVVRLFIITPLLFLYFPARHYAMLARTDAIAHEVLHGLGCMLVVASLMYVYASAQTSSASEYYMGVITVVLYMNTVHRKSFLLAFLATFGCLTIFVIGMQYVTVTSEEAKLPAILCSIGVSIVSLFAAYRIEQVERRDYLASLREKMLLRQIQKANSELQQLSNTDQLTGIRNRRSFDEAARAAFGNNMPRALILLDVDYFKNYNDSEGHVAGDDCLRVIAGRLRSVLRRDDSDRNFVARYGGEEFVVLLDNCVVSAALAIGERLRLAVADEAILHLNRPDGRVIVTVSLGVAVSTDGVETVHEMLKRADMALYEAKHQGRDRMVLASGHSGTIAGPTEFAGVKAEPRHRRTGSVRDVV